MRSGLFLMGPARTELLPQFSWEALQVCEPLGESASVDAGGSGSGVLFKNAEFGGEFSRFLYIGSWFPIGMAPPGVCHESEHFGAWKNQNSAPNQTQ